MVLNLLFADEKYALALYVAAHTPEFNKVTFQFGNATLQEFSMISTRNSPRAPTRQAESREPCWPELIGFDTDSAAEASIGPFQEGQAYSRPFTSQGRCDQADSFLTSPVSDSVVAFLANKQASGADSTQIAVAIVNAVQAIDSALAPVVGQRGFAALFKRCVHVAAVEHPWMGDVQAGATTAVDLLRLRTVFEQQSCADAAVGGSLLLQTFYELLASLVGRSLAERLLRSVWRQFLSAASAQDLSE